MKVTIYSDGGADPNPGYGGWGAVLIYGKHTKELKGSAKDTTNNRMELSAAIGALNALKRPCEIEFFTDSQYLRRGILENLEKWVAADFKRKGETIPNKDLWKKLHKLIEPHTIQWNWVKGHSGDHYNEIVDKLATEARQAITPTVGLSTDQPTLYARGSFKGKTNSGGWAYILKLPNGDTIQNSGNASQTTANRMHIEAVMFGLNDLPKNVNSVQVVTVSDYVFLGATEWIKGWKKRNWEKKGGESVSNSDLWQQLDQLSSKIQIVWFNGKNTILDGDELEMVGKRASEVASDL